MANDVPTILQMIPRLDTGGAELSTLEISQAILSAGGNSLVVTEGGRLISRLKEMGTEVLLMPIGSKNPLFILKNTLSLRSIIQTHKVDLVHARSRAPAWSGLWATQRMGCPFVTTYHGAYSENGPLKSLYNSVMARGDLIIANSSYIRDLIISRYATKSTKIKVIHRGVDIEKFNPSKITPSRIKDIYTRWGIPDYKRIILHPARLTGWKGQPVLLKAIQRLRNKGLPDNVTIILAGDDQGREEYKKSLQETIQSSGLQHVVRLVGHVEDMAAAFRAAEVAVIASTLPEAFGRTAIEAQAMCCPIIATRLGGTTETVLSSPEYSSNSRTGWLIPPGDPDALCDALLESLNLSPEARQQMGKRGREYVSSTFSLSQMRLKTLRVYDELLGTCLEERSGSLGP